jgi:hypothetical protein
MFWLYLSLIRLYLTYFGDYMGFKDTPICQSRTNCFICRNDQNFRDQMEKQHGKWECPENIPIGTPLEKLPEKARQAHQSMMDMQAQRQKQIEEVQVALNELDMVVPEVGKTHVDKVRFFLFPNQKTIDKCKNGAQQIG